MKLATGSFRKRACQYPGMSALVLVGLLLGCASFGRPAERAARLFVEPSATRPLRDEVFLEQAILDAMRQRVAASGEELVAILKLSRGFHPYSVYAFIAEEGQLRVMVTLMSWGIVLEKWEARVDHADLLALEEQADLGTFRCEKTRRFEDMPFRAALVRWSEGEQLVCVSDWPNEEDAELLDNLNEMMSAARLTYERTGQSW